LSDIIDGKLSLAYAEAVELRQSWGAELAKNGPAALSQRLKSFRTKFDAGFPAIGATFDGVTCH
jgi:hypothetical protein